MQSFKRVLKSLGSYWLILSGAGVSLLLVTVANALTPQLFRWGIDQGMTQRNFQIVLYSSGAIILAALGRGLFNFGQSFWAEQASQGLAYDLRDRIFIKIENLSLSYYDQTESSQLLTRITSDVEQIRTFVGNSLVQIIGSVVTVVATAIILLVMNWQLALITLAIVPVAAMALLQFVKKSQSIFNLIQQWLGDLNSVLQENLVGIRVVKSFVRESDEMSRYNQMNDELVKVNMQALRAISNTFPLIFLLSNLITLAVIGYGGAQVIGHRFTIGELVAFNTYLAFILKPILLLSYAAPAIAQAAASAERVYEVVDAQVEILDRPDAVPLQDCTGQITFEDVSFRYPGSETEALKGVSLEIKPRELVAILGTTGSGKSTMMNLILRFYDVTAGVVRLDGHDVRDLKLSSLRDQIGVVFQETTLLSGTIRDNIAYGAPNASLEEVIAAAETAQIHSYITELPEGYQTLVGEKGVGLSGGQKQRIAIARTLLTKYRILLLDDSTSAVDAQTTAQIEEALDLLMHQKVCTALVIAQRISTLRKADRILLVDKGQLVGQGTHDELMSNSPLYSSILESQVKQPAS